MRRQMAWLLCAAAIAVPASAQGDEPPAESPAASRPFVAHLQHGTFLRGSVVVASAPSRLRVDVLAHRDGLGGRGGSEPVRVGHFTDTVATGRRSFAVELNTAAERAVRREGKLWVTAEITVTPAAAAPFTATRSATVKP